MLDFRCLINCYFKSFRINVFDDIHLNGVVTLVQNCIRSIQFISLIGFSECQRHPIPIAYRDLTEVTHNATTASVESTIRFPDSNISAQCCKEYRKRLSGSTFKQRCTKIERLEVLEIVPIARADHWNLRLQFKLKVTRYSISWTQYKRDQKLGFLKCRKSL